MCKHRVLASFNEYIELHNLWVQSGALSQECAGNEPETVRHRELVLHHVRLLVARVRIVPLVRGEARHHKQRERDQHVRGQHIQPDLDGQRIHEGEEARRLTGRHLIKY